jgi:hypothetical protein
MKALLINLLVILFLCLDHTPCLAGLNLKSDGFRLEIIKDNNLFPVWFSFEDIMEELAEDKDCNFPEEILSRGKIFCLLPFWQGETINFGATFQKAGIIQVTGQTLQFYHDYNNPAFLPIKKYYDLGGNSINYSLFGTYVSKRWCNDLFMMVMRGDFFTCYDYLKIDCLGQGWIRRKINGSKYYEIFGEYKKEWPDENYWGWGLGLNYDLFLEKNGLNINLHLLNLPGIIYFPKFYQENGKVDTKEDSIGPIPISGFKTEGSYYRNLPPMVETQLLYTFNYGGAFELKTFYDGEIQDFLAGYFQPVGNIGLTININPVLKNYGLGLRFNHGELEFIFSLNRQMILRGITFKLWE